MPQTPPAHFVMPRKLTDTELAQAIRLDLEAELDAFNLYQSHIDATDNELAKKVLAHIRNEEREHAALFWALLRVLDPALVEEDATAPLKLRLIERGASDVDIEEILEGKKPPPSDLDLPSSGRPAPAAQSPMPRTLTVGSLRGKRQAR